jgi:hypothetical protein
MIKNVGGKRVEDEKEPKIKTSRTINDVAGLGEAVKSIFSFFEKIIDKLPFSKITPAQTQFIVVFVIINLVVTVLTMLKTVSVNAFYVLMVLDIGVVIYSLILTGLKNDAK